MRTFFENMLRWFIIGYIIAVVLGSAAWTVIRGGLLPVAGRDWSSSDPLDY